MRRALRSASNMAAETQRCTIVPLSRNRALVVKSDEKAAVAEKTRAKNPDKITAGLKHIRSKLNERKYKNARTPRNSSIYFSTARRNTVLSSRSNSQGKRVHYRFTGAWTNRLWPRKNDWMVNTSWWPTFPLRRILKQNSSSFTRAGISTSRGFGRSSPISGSGLFS